MIDWEVRFAAELDDELSDEDLVAVAGGDISQKQDVSNDADFTGGNGGGPGSSHGVKVGRFDQDATGQQCAVCGDGNFALGH